MLWWKKEIGERPIHRGKRQGEFAFFLLFGSVKQFLRHVLTWRNGLLRNLAIYLCLYTVLFFSYTFSEEKHRFSIPDLLFFSTYVLAATLINEVLLPKLFYRRRYLLFLLGLLAVLSFAVFMEEFVWEQVFFPESRGKHFHGYFYSLVELSPLILIMVGLKLGLDSLKRQKEIEQLRTAVLESELQFLKSQINPHFLFNSLNNLYAHALTQSPKTPQIILELSSLFRYVLQSAKKQWVPLELELEHLRDYVHLLELQIENRGKVNLEIPEFTGKLHIAPLILSVFVENAFKHGSNEMAQGILIDISIELDGHRLLFRCENNFEVNQNLHNLPKGIGLENVRNRLDHLYPGKYSLEVKELEKRFLVLLQLSLHHD